MNEIDWLLDTIHERKSLEPIVKIHENDGHVALGLDLAALRPVSFAGGIAEFIYSYASYLATNEQRPPYPNAAFEEFESEFFGGMEITKRSWIDLYHPQDREFCFRVFQNCAGSA
jgi:hypothetical protein